MQSKSSTVEPSFVANQPKIRRKKPYLDVVDDKRKSGPETFRSAVACIDNSPGAISVFRHAKAVASGLDIPVRLAHVLQGAASDVSPSNPIEWQIRMREAREYLSRILKSENSPVIRKDRLLFTGVAGQEISRWVRENGGNLVALATRCGLENGASESARDDIALGRTTQMVLDGTTASLLLVPPATHDAGEVGYRRLVVPLDGSCRAESVLPFAVRIARKHGAQLLLVHVLPRPEIVSAGRHDAEADEFSRKLRQFNEQNARAYLDRLQCRLSSGGLVVRAITENEGDVRERLPLVAKNCDADLIVMSARGKGSIHNMSCGNVARYIAAHTSLPLLLIRQQMTQPVDQLKLPEHQYGPRLFWESAH